MIFATVGMHSAPFDRLIRHVDRIAGLTEEEVFMQIGTASDRPSVAHSRFLSEEDYESAFATSRVVVSHAGVGTILRCALSEKPLVCAPRLKRHGEHWDDHQLDLCRALSREGTFRFLEDLRELNLEELDTAVPPQVPRSDLGLAQEILSFLSSSDPQTLATE